MNGIGKTLLIYELANKLGIKMEEYTMKDRDKYLAKLEEIIEANRVQIREEEKK